MRAWLLLATAVVAAALAWPQAAAAESRWRQAALLGEGLFAAQQGLLLADRAAAVRAARRAATAYAPLASPLRRADPEAGNTARRGLRAATAAARRGDARALAAARGTVRAAVLRGAYAAAVEAAAAGDAAEASSWLLLREFRTATRYTRPTADATLAVERLRTGKLAPRAAADAVRRDLLDAYQARTRELLDDTGAALERRFFDRAAETSARAAGLWELLQPRFAEDRGAAAATRERAAFGRLAAAALAGDAAVAGRALEDARASLDGFIASPLTRAESARRAQQLLRFVELVPVEYERGVDDRRVTLDFEIQEAVAFHKAAGASFADLRDQLAKRDRGATEVAAQGLRDLGARVGRAAQEPDGVATADEVERIARGIDAALRRSMPAPWLEPTDESDYDLIALALDRMQAAAAAGHARQAEQARLEAYAFFEFGPERRLKAFSPGLALDIEGLVWFGARDREGLAQLIARRAPVREMRATRRELDGLLADARATLGDAAEPVSVITNAAVLVFREGLEAVLILAAITASFVGVRRRLRRPVLIGAVIGLALSLVTWLLALTLLRSLERFGEKLEAVVGLVAIAVLLLITNWFFHRVYWSEWIGRFHRRRRTLMAAERTGLISGQALGLALLGLSSVYREGFETVLFLQSLQLNAGTPTVVAGAGLGLALTLGVAVVTFALQRKLPYKKMLIVTGVLIGFVLVVMVGQTTRTMQGTGWLPISPIDVDVPYWAGLWLGVFPTWETLAAQLAAAAFVIGSYFLAQEVRVKRPQRRARAAASPSQGPTTPASAERPAPDRMEAVARSDELSGVGGRSPGQP